MIISEQASLEEGVRGLEALASCREEEARRKQARPQVTRYWKQPKCGSQILRPYFDTRYWDPILTLRPYIVTLYFDQIVYPPIAGNIERKRHGENKPDLKSPDFVTRYCHQIFWPDIVTWYYDQILWQDIMARYWEEKTKYRQKVPRCWTVLLR